MNMLAKWTEILPLFIVRLLAKRYCERVKYHYEGEVPRTFVICRPDVLVKIEQQN